MKQYSFLTLLSVITLLLSACGHSSQPSHSPEESLEINAASTTLHIRQSDRVTVQLTGGTEKHTLYLVDSSRNSSSQLKSPKESTGLLTISPSSCASALDCNFSVQDNPKHPAFLGYHTLTAYSDDADIQPQQVKLYVSAIGDGGFIRLDPNYQIMIAGGDDSSITATLKMNPLGTLPKSLTVKDADSNGHPLILTSESGGGNSCNVTWVNGQYQCQVRIVSDENTDVQWHEITFSDSRTSVAPLFPAAAVVNVLAPNTTMVKLSPEQVILSQDTSSSSADSKTMTVTVYSDQYQPPYTVKVLDDMGTGHLCLEPKGAQATSCQQQATCTIEDDDTNACQITAYSGVKTTFATIGEHKLKATATPDSDSSIDLSSNYAFAYVTPSALGGITVLGNKYQAVAQGQAVAIIAQIYAATGKVPSESSLNIKDVTPGLSDDEKITFQSPSCNVAAGDKKEQCVFKANDTSSASVQRHQLIISASVGEFKAATAVVSILTDVSDIVLTPISSRLVKDSGNQVTIRATAVSDQGIPKTITLKDAIYDNYLGGNSLCILEGSKDSDCSDQKTCTLVSGKSACTFEVSSPAGSDTANFLHELQASATASDGTVVFNAQPAFVWVSIGNPAGRVVIPGKKSQRAIQGQTTDIRVTALMKSLDGKPPNPLTIKDTYHNYGRHISGTLLVVNNPDTACTAIGNNDEECDFEMTVLADAGLHAHRLLIESSNADDDVIPAVATVRVGRNFTGVMMTPTLASLSQNASENSPQVMTVRVLSDQYKKPYTVTVWDDSHPSHTLCFTKEGGQDNDCTDYTSCTINEGDKDSCSVEVNSSSNNESLSAVGLHILMTSVVAADSSQEIGSAQSYIEVTGGRGSITVLGNDKYQMVGVNQSFTLTAEVFAVSGDLPSISQLQVTDISPNIGDDAKFTTVTPNDCSPTSTNKAESCRWTVTAKNIDNGKNQQLHQVKISSLSGSFSAAIAYVSVLSQQTKEILLFPSFREIKVDGGHTTIRAKVISGQDLPDSLTLSDSGENDPNALYIGSDSDDGTLTKGAYTCQLAGNSECVFKIQSGKNGSDFATSGITHHLTVTAQTAGQNDESFHALNSAAVRVSSEPNTLSTDSKTLVIDSNGVTTKSVTLTVHQNPYSSTMPTTVTLKDIKDSGDSSPVVISDCSKLNADNSCIFTITADNPNQVGRHLLLATASDTIPLSILVIVSDAVVDGQIQLSMPTNTVISGGTSQTITATVVGDSSTATTLMLKAEGDNPTALSLVADNMAGNDPDECTLTNNQCTFKISDPYGGLGQYGFVATTDDENVTPSAIEISALPAFSTAYNREALAATIAFRSDDGIYSSNDAGQHWHYQSCIAPSSSDISPATNPQRALVLAKNPMTGAITIAGFCSNQVNPQLVDSLAYTAGDDVWNVFTLGSGTSGFSTLSPVLAANAKTSGDSAGAVTIVAITAVGNLVFTHDSSGTAWQVYGRDNGLYFSTAPVLAANGQSTVAIVDTYQTVTDHNNDDPVYLAYNTDSSQNVWQVYGASLNYDFSYDASSMYVHNLPVLVRNSKTGELTLAIVYQTSDDPEEYHLLYTAHLDAESVWSTYGTVDDYNFVDDEPYSVVNMTSLPVMAANPSSGLVAIAIVGRDANSHSLVAYIPDSSLAGDSDPSAKNWLVANNASWGNLEYSSLILAASSSAVILAIPYFNTSSAGDDWAWGDVTASDFTSYSPSNSGDLIEDLTLVHDLASGNIVAFFIDEASGGIGSLIYTSQLDSSPTWHQASASSVNEPNFAQTGAPTALATPDGVVIAALYKDDSSEKYGIMYIDKLTGDDFNSNWLNFTGLFEMVAEPPAITLNQSTGKVSIASYGNDYFMQSYPRIIYYLDDASTTNWLTYNLDANNITASIYAFFPVNYAPVSLSYDPVTQKVVMDSAFGNYNAGDTPTDVAFIRDDSSSDSWVQLP